MDLGVVCLVPYGMEKCRRCLMDSKSCEEMGDLPDDWASQHAKTRLATFTMAYWQRFWDKKAAVIVHPTWTGEDEPPLTLPEVTPVVRSQSRASGASKATSVAKLADVATVSDTEDAEEEPKVAKSKKGKGKAVARSPAPRASGSAAPNVEVRKRECFSSNMFASLLMIVLQVLAPRPPVTSRLSRSVVATSLKIRQPFAMTMSRCPAMEKESFAPRSATCANDSSSSTRPTYWNRPRRLATEPQSLSLVVRWTSGWTSSSIPPLSKRSVTRSKSSSRRFANAWMGPSTFLRPLALSSLTLAKTARVKREWTKTMTITCRSVGDSRRVEAAKGLFLDVVARVP